MAIPNPYNIDFADGGLVIDPLPSAVVLNKAAALAVSAWLFSVADRTAGMRGGDAVFVYNASDEPAVDNIYNVSTVGPNVKINDPPPEGFVSFDDALKGAVWLAYYATDGVPSGRGLKDGEGMKERPELWVAVEDVCGASDIANQRV